MTYRCVCPRCTAFIRSLPEPVADPEAYERWVQTWGAECDEWLAFHVCGEDDGDGVEDERRFAFYANPE